MANPSRFDWFFRPNLADEDLPLSAELRFAEALAELPAIERSALALSEIGGLGTEEIAQRLGTDVTVVQKLLVRARLTVRATIAVRARRGVLALIPFQNWWSSGSTGPVVRTAGAVAAAVLGTGIAIGGAAADRSRPVLVSPDPPVVRSLKVPRDRHVPTARAPAADRPVRAQSSAEDAAGPATVRPESDRYGDIGARPDAPTGGPSAPARRGDEPEIGARLTPLPAPAPTTESPLEEPPAPPPLPFPTPYPAPVLPPVPIPAPVPLSPVKLHEDPPVELPPLPPLP